MSVGGAKTELAEPIRVEGDSLSGSFGLGVIAVLVVAGFIAWASVY